MPRSPGDRYDVRFIQRDTRRGSVSLESGEFASLPTDVTNPEWIRFHKSFTSYSTEDLGQRSVFVVSAVSFRPVSLAG